ncbi:hypothetical protein P153DRAFT_303310 [Dothidotthia symphoricarpi CBS 119687]|uniref:DUF6594 domain-containing protein n=1 Tax=Dothidotthia symphoricarpi CBS 119687 TaxID=1392245 RepID=A0A6A5ZWK8_9PLEO|nr:uncharacterized protein P153DRAFT_303310 [Dothidotthia symphoricarpi CBS 119687]KAF2123919.1 hypothetical protein P153DRAFT_303310 [Dothidotthia symphoricarpi CBS 119687]
MASHDPFPDVVIGYPKLAARIEIQPEIAIYRRFGALNAQNLLYFQAELSDLEQELKKQQVEDSNSQEGKRSSYAKNWSWLQESELQGDENARQVQLVLRIRETLREYNHALIQQSVILDYPEPGRWDLHYIQDYLQNPRMGTLVLEGEDSTIWGSMHNRTSHKPDLIALHPRAKKDPFSMWAAKTAISNLFCLARCLKPSAVHGTIGYDDSTIYRITYWITSILASLIPIASIVVLYCVQSMPAKLGIIAAFNVLVSVCLMGFANAKRVEVFAITAAYVCKLSSVSKTDIRRFAAVQVVFVASDKSNQA